MGQFTFTTASPYRCTAASCPVALVFQVKFLLFSANWTTVISEEVICLAEPLEKVSRLCNDSLHRVTPLWAVWWIKFPIKKPKATSHAFFPLPSFGPKGLHTKSHLHYLQQPEHYLMKDLIIITNSYVFSLIPLQITLSHVDVLSTYLRRESHFFFLPLQTLPQKYYLLLSSGWLCLISGLSRSPWFALNSLSASKRHLQGEKGSGFDSSNCI